MHLKKFISTVLIFSCIVFFVSTKETLTPPEEQAIYDFLQLRVNLTVEKNEQIALNKIEDYKTHLFNTTYYTYSSEVQFILENFLILEKFYYIYSDDIDNPILSNIILQQKEKNDLWFSNHNNEPINKWLYCTYADILSWSLQYLPKTEMIKTGFKVKEYYNEALKFDPDMSYALFGLGQWYIQAPIIGGGSTTKAIQKFQHSLDSSCSKEETFYACILLSQAYFEKNKIEMTTTLLQKALSIEPHSTYVAFIQLLNKNDHSLYYYTSHKTKVNNDLKLK